MRYIAHIVSVFLFVAVGGWAHAQTPTSTPHPNALPPGLYQFEDLSSPEMQLSGAGWFIYFRQSQTVLANATNTNTMKFWVGSDADYMILNVGTKSGTAPEWTICVDAICKNRRDRGPDTGFSTVAIDLFQTNSEVIITKTNTEESAWDYMQIILDPNSIPTPVSGSSPSATATPEGYYIFGTVTGVSGTVATRFDMVVTAGDVAISNALIFLFFSLWAIIFISYFVSRNRV